MMIKPLSDKIGKEIPFPFYATNGSAGMDLSACIDEPITLKPGERKLIPTGIAIALPNENCVGLIYARSSLGYKNGITLANCVGVIDSDYRGELLVALINLSEEEYTIAPSQRIAQLVITPIVRPEISIVEELPETIRGAGGFGSTGKGHNQ